jgi:hypothetical protein
MFGLEILRVKRMRIICYRVFAFIALAELTVRTLNYSVIFMKEKDVLYIICFIFLFCFVCF